jgi:hypothetical protein
MVTQIGPCVRCVRPPRQFLSKRSAKPIAGWTRCSTTCQAIQTIAAAAGKTERSARVTLSLVFLAPDLTKAAVEGKHPGRGSQEAGRSSDGPARSMEDARSQSAEGKAALNRGPLGVGDNRISIHEANTAT